MSTTKTKNKELALQTTPNEVNDNGVIITETKNENLLREYALHIPAHEIDKLLQEQLVAKQKNLTLPGFRKGKVPFATIKQLYGQDIMQKVAKHRVEKDISQFIKGKEVKLAYEPSYKITSYNDEDGLDCTFSYEELPIIPDITFDELTLKDYSCKNIAEAKEKLMSKIQQDFQAQEEAAKEGDQLLLDFIGTYEDVPFDGGTAKDYVLIIGSRNHIPGFEEQLIGAKPQEERTINVTFPVDYGAKELAGKDVQFAMTIKEVRKPAKVELSEEFAKKQGYNSLEHLHSSMDLELETLFQSRARNKMKEELFDLLHEKCDFTSPNGLVEKEYFTLRKQEHPESHQDHPHVHSEHCSHGEEDENLITPESMHNDPLYAIAERRVRIGLYLIELSRIHSIQVLEEDIRKALTSYMKNSPQEGQRIIQALSKNPERVEELKGPILEEKVVDYILTQIKKETQSVDFETFYPL